MGSIRIPPSGGRSYTHRIRSIGEHLSTCQTEPAKIEKRCPLRKGAARMLEQIAEALLPHVVDYLLTKGTLTPRQQQVQREFFADLKPMPRKTPYPLIVAVIGLTGAGKSSVARELVKHLG